MPEQTEYKQSAECLLGEKVFESDEKDEFGYVSPQKVMLVGQADDSLELLMSVHTFIDGCSVQVVPTKHYYFSGKSDKYAYFLTGSDSLINTLMSKQYFTTAVVTKIWKFRPDNFSQTKATKSTVTDLYKAYNVNFISDSVAEIFPKQFYNRARYFHHFILFDEAQREKQSITLHDYIRSAFHPYKGKYYLSFTPVKEHTFYNFSDAGYIVCLNDKFKVEWTHHFVPVPAFKEVTITEVTTSGIKVHITLVNVCTECKDQFSHYDLLFSHDGRLLRYDKESLINIDNGEMINQWEYIES